MEHKDSCILSSFCSLASSDKCNALCQSYIAVHGFNGAGGRVAAANVPHEYQSVMVKTSPARENQEESYITIDAYVNTFQRQFYKDGERIKSLYLYSASPGTGKTTSAAAILNEYIVRHYIGSVQRNRQPLDRPAYFLDVNAWQELYTEFTRPHIPVDIAEPASREYYRQMQYARLAPFAVLDDIGVRAATDGFRGDLHSVINYRVTNGLPTVYTSNVEVGELAHVFDKRLADRVRDMCGVVRFKGESKRGIR